MAKPIAGRIDGSRQELLDGQTLFSGLSAEDLKKLARHSVVKHCRPKEVIFRKGDPGDGLYLVTSGRVVITSISAEGQETILAIMGKGDVFGEIAVLDGKTRTAEAMAIEGSELLFVGRRELLAFLAAHPDLCMKMFATLCERVRHATQIIEDRAFLNLESRLAKTLLSLADVYGVPDQDGVRIDVRLTQYDLGNMTGTSRESINKLMNEWEETGLLLTRRGRIVLRRPDDIRRRIIEK